MRSFSVDGGVSSKLAPATTLVWRAGMLRRPNERRIVFRSAGHVWLKVGGTALGVVCLIGIVARPSAAQAAPSLIFERPATQSQGTSDWAFISDPTIQPFLAPGIPATIIMGASIDLRGNGRPDIVVCHGAHPWQPAGKAPCRVLRPQSDGSVVDITRQLFGAGALPSSVYLREIVSGDFNRDGRSDIFVAATGYDAAPYPGETNLLLISNADGTYADRSATLPQIPDFSHSACVGDINGDGNLDLYVGNVFGAGRVGPYFLMGKGDGSFTQKTSGLPPPIQSLQEKFLSCLLLDVDGDQSPDLVLGTHGDANGLVDDVVLFNDGTGDFGRRARLVLPKGPLPADNFCVLDIVSLDVNRDGRPDLILLSSAVRTNSGVGLQVLINQANGTFVDETAARLGPSTARLTGLVYPFIRLADFNGDGLEDFFLEQIGGAEDGLPNSRIWLNNANGTFTPIAASALPQDFTSYASLFAVDFDGDGRPDVVQLGNVWTLPPHFGDINYRSFLNRTARTAFATMSLSRSRLNFGAVNNGGVLTFQTPTQRVALTQSGPGTVTWTAAASQPWITVSPQSGTGAAMLQVSMASAGVALPASGVLGGTMTVTTTGAANRIGPINVTLTTVSSTAAASVPFGSFDTPAGDASVLAGSIAITGWTLDNIGVKQLELWRDRQAGETTPPGNSTPGDPRNGKIFISNATFVDNARPDVEGLNPTIPSNYRAGWGYLMLTWGLFGQGNGTYKFHAFGVDVEGNTATIGTKTVVISNDTATKPFGSIDTPGIGGDASGPNFGWGLTPKVNGAATCKIQPSGVQYSIDSGPLQPAVYGDARSDIAGAFPGFSNTAAAGGHAIIDWTALTNGSHTIGWLITDDCNRADGVGSRFFNVTSGVSALTAAPGEFRLQAETSSDAEFHLKAEPHSDAEFRLKAETTEFGSVASAFRRNSADGEASAFRRNEDAVLVSRGYGELPEIVTADQDGNRTIEVKQGDRIEIRVPRGFESAYQLGNDGRRRALPTGTTWDAPSGIFYWQPAPGFLGRFRIVFSNGSERISVRVVVTP